MTMVDLSLANFIYFTPFLSYCDEQNIELIVDRYPSSANHMYVSNIKVSEDDYALLKLTLPVYFGWLSTTIIADRSGAIQRGFKVPDEGMVELPVTSLFPVDRLKLEYELFKDPLFRKFSDSYTTKASKVTYYVEDEHALAVHDKIRSLGHYTACPC